MDERLIRDIAFASGGLIVGFAGGYFLSKRHYKAKYRLEADAEIEQVTDRFKRLRKEEEYETATKAAETLGHDTDLYNKPQVLTEDEARQFTVEGKEYAEHLVENGYTQETAEELLEVIQEKTTLRVFDTKQPTPEELEPGALHGERIDGQPYVISLAEFMQNSDYENVSLNYFEADQTLCTDNEEIITDIERTVGVANMHRFGQGSEDPATVYVRNEASHTDYEIVLDERGYAEVILGQTPSPS